MSWPSQRTHLNTRTGLPCRCSRAWPPRSRRIWWRGCASPLTTTCARAHTGVIWAPTSLSWAHGSSSPPRARGRRRWTSWRVCAWGTRWGGSGRGPRRRIWRGWWRMARPSGNACDARSSTLTAWMSRCVGGGSGQGTRHECVWLRLWGVGFHDGVAVAPRRECAVWVWCLTPVWVQVRSICGRPSSEQPDDGGSSGVFHDGVAMWPRRDSIWLWHWGYGVSYPCGGRCGRSAVGCRA
jgi:hypothetical protein